MEELKRRSTQRYAALKVFFDFVLANIYILYLGLCPTPTLIHVQGSHPERLVSGSDDFTLFLWNPAEEKKHTARMTGEI